MAAIEVEQGIESAPARCAHLTKAGAPCRMPALTGTSACVNHSPGAQALRLRAASASVEARRRRAAERREARTRTAQDWIAVALEERGREIAEAVAQAAVDGDWRAAQALWERVYGKPVERVEGVQLDVDLRTLTDAQLEAMRAQLLRGTTGGTTG